MINHARTLLINADAAANDATIPGYALTDPGYRARRLPPAVQRIHTLLFGARPDWLMRNYRAEQCLQIVDASRLRDMPREYDPRISYALGVESNWSRRLGIYVTQSAGLSLEGADPGLVGDSSGCCLRRWELVAPAADTLVVTSLSPPGDALVFESPYAGPVTLPDGPRLRIRAIDSGAWGQIDAYLRPGIQLADALASARAAVESAVVASLFPPDGSERQQRLRRVWLEGDTFDRDASLLLGLVEYLDRLGG